MYSDTQQFFKEKIYPLTKSEEGRQILEKYGLLPDGITEKTIEPEQADDAYNKMTSLIDEIDKMMVPMDDERLKVPSGMMRELKIVAAESQRRTMLLEERMMKMALENACSRTFRSFDIDIEKGITPADLMEEVFSGHDMINLLTQQYIATNEKGINEAFFVKPDEIEDIFRMRYEEDRDGIFDEHNRWLEDLREIRGKNPHTGFIEIIPHSESKDYFDSAATYGWVTCEEFGKRFMRSLEQSLHKVHPKTLIETPEQTTNDPEL